MSEEYEERHLEFENVIKDIQARFDPNLIELLLKYDDMFYDLYWEEDNNLGPLLAPYRKC